MRLSRRTGGLLLAVALASGCGSTVQTQRSLQLGPGPLGVDSGSAPVPAASGPPGAADPAGPTAAQRTLAPSGDVGRDPVAPTLGPGTATPASTTSPLRLGIVVTENNAALASSVGLEGVDNGDEQRNAAAIVAAVNAAGGVGGRPVQPVYFTVKMSDANTPSDELYSRVCAYFTQDHDTRIVLASGVFTDQLWACLKGRGGLGIGGNTAYVGDRTTLGYPVLAPNALGLERQLSAQVDALGAGGFFAGAQKYALLSYDDPKFRGAVTRSLKPALKARGITLTDEYYLPPINGLQDEGSHSTAAGSAVLRFRGDGVTRVILAEGSAAGALFFMRQADGQGYRPRYGLTSAQFLNTLAANVPASQLTGSVALGWWPSGDLPSDSVVRTPGRARCVAALARAGIHYAVNSSQEQTAFNQCDMVFAAVDSARAAADTSPAGVLRGARVLGGRWASAAAVQSSFATRDAVSGYRVALFAQACSCFRYSGPNRRID